MKMYTNSEQTAKLIELGFEKPPKKGLLFQSNTGNCHTDLMLAEENYSIGELIEMLNTDNIEINRYSGDWSVDIDYTGARNKELIDALYEMILRLKEDGVI